MYSRNILAPYEGDIFFDDINQVYVTALNRLDRCCIFNINYDDYVFQIEGKFFRITDNTKFYPRFTERRSDYKPADYQIVLNGTNDTEFQQQIMKFMHELFEIVNNRIVSCKMDKFKYYVDLVQNSTILV